MRPTARSSSPRTKPTALEEARAKLGADVALRQDEDVLDTWFSSALWPFSTLGWPDETPELKAHYQTDVLVTAFDIIFFWVARMMMMGLHFMDEVPFHTVYIHALVRDEKGQKMSKSKGNVVDPLELMDKYGADALRFTLAALAVPGRDVRMSEKRVEGYRNFATKLWNASRFAEMNECRAIKGFDPRACTETVNRWIVGETFKAAAKVSQGIEDYRFNDAADAIYHFVWGTYCDWYLEFIKPLLGSNDEAVVTETRATAAWVLDQILSLLHPFMPFITEELWNRISENRDVDADRQRLAGSKPRRPRFRRGSRNGLDHSGHQRDPRRPLGDERAAGRENPGARSGCERSLPRPDRAPSRPAAAAGPSRVRSPLLTVRCRPARFKP